MIAALLSLLALVFAAPLAPTGAPGDAPVNAAPAPDATQEAAADAQPAKDAKETPDAHPLQLHATLDQAEVTLGQPFSLTIEVVHDPADTYALPLDLAAQLAKGSLEIRGETQVARTQIPAEPANALAGNARTILTIPLVDVASMKPTVPELTLEVQGPSGPRRLRLPEQSLAVESLVAKEGAPNDEHAHHGPKPPEPIKVRSYLWLWLLLAIAAIAAAIFISRKLRKRAAEVVAPPPPQESAENEAHRRLRELRNRAPWLDPEGGRAAVFELSEIVRIYLGKQFSFNAIDLTSDELVRALRARGDLGFDVPQFAARVQWEEMVKFAKLPASADECNAALDAAGELVEQARRKLEAVRNADLLAAANRAASSSTAAPGAVASDSKGVR